MPEAHPGLRVKIRCMVRLDWPEVLAIEASRTDTRPMSEAALRGFIQERGVAAYVAEEVTSTAVVGHCIFKASEGHGSIWKLAVHPDDRRLGVGRRLVDGVSLCRSVIRADVRESNLDAHHFFSRVGFRATGVIRDCFATEAGLEDAYRFVRGSWEPT